VGSICIHGGVMDGLYFTKVNNNFRQRNDSRQKRDMMLTQIVGRTHTGWKRPQEAESFVG
jgi:hypothetical protein